MQLQFEKQGISCLQTLKRELQTQEQTQEVRISDGMPDLGSIIGAWGQVILRGKEWQMDAMRVTGGTMVWIQYLPEEGGDPQIVESWIPFQMTWNFPKAKQDGTMMMQPILRSVDTRILSSRKMMLRTNVSVLGWAMEKGEQELCLPGEYPDDIQLLRERYPMELPVEAGEKAFSLEESLSLPPNVPPMEKAVYYSLNPEITEEKLMGDKIVFRGNALFHLCYCGEDGGRYTCDFDLPFTQYSELDREYGEDIGILLWPCVTSLELENGEDGLHLKAGLVCQYRISQRTVLEIVADAFSSGRSVTPIMGELALPGILEEKQQILHAQQNSPVDGMRLTDIQFIPQPVRVSGSAGETSLEIPGTFLMQYYDMEGNLHSATQNWEQTFKLPAGEHAVVEATLWPVGKPQGNLMSGSAALTADLKLITETGCHGGIPMVTGLEMGELQQPDPNRPSLILRRSGGQSLWELAKTHGSTVDAIRGANRLEEEPDETQMLLIPVR